jgi:hypothetical protein
MSTHPVHDVRVDCDHPGCLTVAFGSWVLASEPLTAARVRRSLRRSGWLTAVENATRTPDRCIERGPRLDYCPRHAPEHRRK